VDNDGYVAQDRRVIISPTIGPLTLQLTLAPLASTKAAARNRPVPAAPATTGRYTGGLTVESRPTGARVLIDNRMVGTTPVTLPSVAAGNHAIRLEREGYRRWASQVRVVSGEASRVTASLER
jgi:hypothetical protein